MEIELTLLNLSTDELLLQVRDLLGRILRDVGELDALRERLVLSTVGHCGKAGCKVGWEGRAIQQNDKESKPKGGNQV